MPRLKLTLAYVGTHYQGWQVQAWKDRPQPPTVQAEVEKAVNDVANKGGALADTMAYIHVQGSGRTDSGVHADAQIAHCDIPNHRVHVDWQKALNTRLPKDIRVSHACIVPHTFDACRSVVRKAYTYRLWQDLCYTPPKLYPFVWGCGPLDLAQMDAAIPYLVGTHDFRSFQNAGTDIKSTVRTVFSITRSPLRAHGSEDDLELSLRFESNGFLKQMVRNMTGLLVACGRGKFNPHDVPDLLAACDRRLGPYTAPPQGLSLTQVWYDESVLGDQEPCKALPRGQKELL